MGLNLLLILLNIWYSPYVFDSIDCDRIIVMHKSYLENIDSTN